MDIRLSDASEWELCKQARLAMVAEAPDAFGSTSLPALRAQPDDVWGDYHRRHDEVGGQFFAFIDGDLVGTMRLEAPQDSAELCSVWVAESARGQGVADALLDAVFARARERGFAQMHLWVTNTSVAARRFYARHGFVETGAVQAHTNPSLHELEMSRTL